MCSGVSLCAMWWEGGRVCGMCGDEGNKWHLWKVWVPAEGMWLTIMSDIITKCPLLVNHRRYISEITLYYVSFPGAYCIVFSAGAHHSVVHRLSMSHPCFFPGLLCGKGVKWGVWDLRRCTLVGTGKTKLKKTNNKTTANFCNIHFIMQEIHTSQIKQWFWLIFSPDHSHYDRLWWQGSKDLEWTPAGCHIQHDRGGLLRTSCCKCEGQDYFKASIVSKRVSAKCWLGTRMWIFGHAENVW